MGCVPLPKAEAGEGDRMEVLKLGTLHCLEPKSPVSLTCELRAQLSLTSLATIYAHTYARRCKEVGESSETVRKKRTQVR